MSGACQLFRRDCFEQIGGYVPIKGGGIDWTAVTTARMSGWQTRTFTEKTCLHHRPMGTGVSTGQLEAIFRHGHKDYKLGGHPVWQVFRGVLPDDAAAPFWLAAWRCWPVMPGRSAHRRERPIANELDQIQPGRTNGAL